MSVVIKGLPADHSLAGCMGVYKELVQGINHRPAFVGGDCNDMVLYFNKDGWFVTHYDNQDAFVLWSASNGAPPHLTKNPWVVFEHTKVPTPSFQIMKTDKCCETMLEVTGWQGSMFGEKIAGKYSKQARIHDGKPTYMHCKGSKTIWFEAGSGWCVGDEPGIGRLRMCMFHASDFAPTPDAVQSTWTRKPDPVADPRVQVVLASAEPSPCPAEQESFAGNAALQVAVIGLSEGYNGLYEKVQHMEGGTVVYQNTHTSGNRVVWYNKGNGEWCIGPEGSKDSYGYFAIAATSKLVHSPLASDLAWYEPAWEPHSSIRVTKSKKKHTKVIEVKGVPTDDFDLALLNGKYRQQAQVVDGRPTFKGGQDSKQAIWYSVSAGSWGIGEACFMGTSAHLVHTKGTAATPNTVKATWYVSTTFSILNPYAKIILPSVEAAEQEVPRQLQLKIPEVMVAGQMRCLGCGHQYTSLLEVVFHECLFSVCVCVRVCVCSCVFVHWALCC
jgi:hypothetical protein